MEWILELQAKYGMWILNLTPLIKNGLKNRDIQAKQLDSARLFAVPYVK